MAKEPAIEIDGEITETLPNAMFKGKAREWSSSIGSYIW